MTRLCAQFDQFGCENVTCGDIDPVLGTTPEFEGYALVRSSFGCDFIGAQNHSAD